MFSQILNYFTKIATQPIANIQAFDVVNKGTWSLNNYNSCSSCPSLVMLPCNMEIFKISSSHDVHVLDIGELVKASLTTPIKSCQYLMCDDIFAQRKLVFCSLCCTNLQYLTGGLIDTRQRIAEKIDSIIQFLSNDVVVNQFLLTCTSREYILGWRENNARPVANNKATQGMSSFTQKLAFTNAASFTIATGHHNFTLKVIKYPYVYQW